MKKFAGVTTALITPFKNGKIDEESFLRLVKAQVHAGIQGFVINGTTAESPTLKASEVKLLFKMAKQNTPKGFPLIVGTGSNSTEQTVQNSKAAEKMGADAILVVVPYYNKPPQAGLLAHFKEVADSVEIPTILYNVPSRTITSLEVETIHKLAAHPKIIGIKEASGNIATARKIRQVCGEDFLLLTGDDGTYDEFMKACGDGVISVASHVIPKAMLQVVSQDYAELIHLLFAESNPIPVKAALKELGLISSAEVRLPLVECSAGLVEKMRKELKRQGLV